MASSLLSTSLEAAVLAATSVILATWKDGNLCMFSSDRNLCRYVHSHYTWTLIVAELFK